MFPASFEPGGAAVRAGRSAHCENTGVLVSKDVVLRTPDGIRLTARHWDPGLRDLGCVVAHGFTGSSRTPSIETISRALAGHGVGVLAIDFRGHGHSAGRSTVGDLEIHDVATAVEWLRGHGYAACRRAGLVDGRFGRAALRRARRRRRRGREHLLARPLVRARHPAHARRPLAVRDAHRTRGAANQPQGAPGRHGLGAGTRGAARGGRADRAGAAAHRPRRRRPVFPACRTCELLREAAPAAEVWIEPGMGHAETATTPELVERIVAWLRREVAPASTSGSRGRSATMVVVTDGTATDADDLDESDAEARFNFTGSAAIAIVVGVALAWTARSGATQLLVAIAAVQALLAFGWSLGLRPARPHRGAIVIAALAAAGADVAVSIWPHSRLSPLLAVLGLAMPVLLVHQLMRGVGRVRVVESLGSIAHPRRRRDQPARAAAAAARVPRRRRRRRRVRRRRRPAPARCWSASSSTWSSPHRASTPPSRAGCSRSSPRPRSARRSRTWCCATCANSPAGAARSPARPSARWSHWSRSPSRSSSTARHCPSPDSLAGLRPALGVLMPLALIGPVALLLCLAIRA